MLYRANKTKVFRVCAQLKLRGKDTMKITKVRVRQGNEQYSAKHHRNIHTGMLHKVSNNQFVDTGKHLNNITDTFIQSFIDKLIFSKNEQWLCFEMHKFLQKIYDGNNTNNDANSLREKIKDKYDVILSNRGKEFCCGKLQCIIEKIAKNQEIPNEDYDDIKEKMKEDISNYRKHIGKSIVNNNINVNSLCMVKNDDQKQLSHGEWLVQFIRKNSVDDENIIDDERLKTFEKLFQYDELSCKLTECLKKYETELNKLNSIEEGDKEGQKQIRQYKQECLTEIHDIYKKHEVKHYKDKEGESTKKHEMYFAYYIREVREYFNHYFPFQNNTRKQSINKRDIKNFITYIDKYANIEKIKTIVKYQILNKLTSQLILEGKLTYFSDSFNKEMNQFTSDDLELIHVQEAFKKQLLTSIAWSTSQLRFIMLGEQDTTQLGDILLQGNFDKALKTAENNKYEATKRLKWFLNNILNDNGETIITEDNISNLLTSIHKYIYNNRNKIYHFSKEYFLDDKNFYIDDSDKSTKKLYANDKDSVSAAFKEKIRSMNLYTCYDSQTQKDILGKVNFSLSHPNISIVPSFKNVYNKGKNLQQGNTDAKTQQGNNIHGLEWFILPAEDKNKLLNSSEEVRVYRNFLQLIYEYAFLPSINKSGITNLRYLHDSVIGLNKKVSENRQTEANIERDEQNQKEINDNEFKYEIIKTFGKDFFKDKLQKQITKEDCKDYFKKLQSFVIKKENENQENKAQGKLKAGSEKDKNIYVDFVRDLYVFAFNQFLEGKYKLVPGIKKQLRSPQYNEEATFDDKLKITVNTSYLPSTAPQLYLMARLLDADQLNDLRHQFMRYSVSIPQIYEKDDDAKIGNKVQDIINVLTMVNLTGVNYTESLTGFLNDNSEDIKQLYTSFMDNNMDITDCQDLYVQTDGKTLILHKGIGATYRSGCLSLYKEAYGESNKISSKDCDDYLCWNKTNGINSSKIEALQKTREVLHDEITKKDKHDRIDNYKQAVTHCDKYNQLKNKVTFNNIYSLGQLHRNILSRFIGFAVDWERDMHFLLIALTKHGIVEIRVLNDDKKLIKSGFASESTTIKETVDSVYNTFFNHVYGGTVKNIYKELDSNAKLKELFLALYHVNQNPDFDIRNWVAHLNHIQPGGKAERSLVDAINDLRKLLSYDRKRKNAVTKAIIEMMEKEKIGLTFELDGGHDFKLNEVESEQITHLKNVKVDNVPKKFDIPARSRNFCELVEKLFNQKIIK